MSKYLDELMARDRARIKSEKRERMIANLAHTLNDMDKKNELTPTLILEQIVSGGLPGVKFTG